MKRLSIIIVAMFGVALIGGSIAQAQSGKVVYYAAGGAKVSKALVKAFNEKYPNITVETILGGSGEVLTRIKAERKNPRGDVYRASVEAFDDALELFESYKIKEHDKFPKDAVEKNFRHYGYTTAIQLFIMNTKIMKREEAPKSWKDLGHPKYKGKIIMSHPSLSGSGYRQMAQMIQLHGWDLFEKVITNTTFVPSSRLVYTNVAKGEIPLGVTEESKPYDFARRGYPVVAIYPSEGVAMSYGSVGIIKGGPNPENARIFVDFINSKEGHAVAVKVVNRRSPRPDVEAPKDMPPTKSIHFFPYDRIRAAKNRDAYLKKFEELFGKKK